MKKNQNLSKKAFVHSLRGKLICYVEWILIMLLISFLAEKLIINYAVNTPDFILKNILGDFLSLFIFGVGIFFGFLMGNLGISLFAWRIFSPSYDDIQKYKISKIEELNEEIEDCKEKIKEINENWGDSIEEEKNHISEIEEEIKEMEKNREEEVKEQNDLIFEIEEEIKSLKYS